jgi:O-antigen/teichoic acid export membrane protein
VSAATAGRGGVRSMVRVFSFDVVSKLMLGGMAVALIRVMPAPEYARYTVALAVINFAAQTLSSSFNRIYIVGYERLKLHGSSSSFLGFQLLAVGVAAVAGLPFRGVAGGLYAAVVAVTAATCLSEFAKTVYQQELRFARFTQVELARSLLTVGGVAAAVWVARGGVRAGGVLAVQAAAMASVFSLTMLRRVKGREVLHPGAAWRFAAQVARGRYGWLFAYFVLLGLLSQLDVFLLSTLAPEGEVAAYGAAFRFYSLLSLALASVHAVLLPTLQKVSGPAEQDEVLARQWKMLAVFAPVVLCGAWLSGWIIPWLDGGRYPDAVPAFRILALSAILSFAFSPHSHVLLRLQDFRFLCLLVVVALPLHAALLRTLVPPDGAVGAAVSTLAAFAVVNGSIFARSRWHRRRWQPAPPQPPAGAAEPAAAPA